VVVTKREGGETWEEKDSEYSRGPSHEGKPGPDHANLICLTRGSSNLFSALALHVYTVILEIYSTCIYYIQCKLFYKNSSASILFVEQYHRCDRRNRLGVDTFRVSKTICKSQIGEKVFRGVGWVTPRVIEDLEKILAQNSHSFILGTTMMWVHAVDSVKLC
jgi:hypothetical protein